MNIKQTLSTVAAIFVSAVVPFRIYDASANSPVNCGSKTASVAGEVVTATASSWSNLRNNKGSLRFESSRLLSTPAENVPPPPPSLACPNGCVPGSHPEIVFESVPNKDLEEYGERSHCEGLLKQTSAKPFEYNGKSFADSVALNEWFGDFSQGKGPEGTDLYARCDGSCSPRYTCIIRKAKDGTLRVDASVICGHARDKDENNYKLTLSYRYHCEAATE